MTIGLCDKASSYSFVSPEKEWLLRKEYGNRYIPKQTNEDKELKLDVIHWK